MRLSAFYLMATAFLACGIDQSLAQDDSQIATITEPLGGQPAAGAKPSVPDLNYQVAYQRAFEAVIWSMPAVAIYGFYRAAMDIGAKDNTILAWSQPAKPNAELLTANNQVPYILSQTDLRRGPVVIEVPAATEKASLYEHISLC